MPRANSVQKANAELLEEELIKQIREMFKEDVGSILAIAERAESKKVNVSITAKIDLSEKVPILETAESFREVHKQKRVSNFDDPDQSKLDLPGSGGVNSRSSRRKKAEAEAEAAE